MGHDQTGATTRHMPAPSRDGAMATEKHCNIGAASATRRDHDERERVNYCILLLSESTSAVAR